jgi:hypothetical protein
MQELWDCMSLYNLPDDLTKLGEQKHRVKADQESKAKALQHLASQVSWLLAEAISVRRDHYLTESKLSQTSKDVLRMQPFGGPFLYHGRADEVVKRDSELNTANLVLNMNQQLAAKRPPSATVSKPPQTQVSSGSKNSGAQGKGNSARGDYSFRGYEGKKPRREEQPKRTGGFRGPKSSK